MSSEKFNILIVDDEEDILEFLSYNLKKEGFSVYIARDGHSAIEQAKKLIPHLILLDTAVDTLKMLQIHLSLKQIMVA